MRKIFFVGCTLIALGSWGVQSEVKGAVEAPESNATPNTTPDATTDATSELREAMEAKRIALLGDMEASRATILGVRLAVARDLARLANLERVSFLQSRYGGDAVAHLKGHLVLVLRRGVRESLHHLAHASAALSGFASDLERLEEAIERLDTMDDTGPAA